MSSSRNSTRQRLIDAALELFAAQGVTETTTKQIAERAEVNEVTLFRQFSNKHGLLLAVIDESSVFIDLGRELIAQVDQGNNSVDQALKGHAVACLKVLERVPEVVRSVVGESGQYPTENRQALGRGFTQANRYVAGYFEAMIAHGQLQAHLSAEKLASLLHSMVLGYAVIEFTSERHDLWRDREDFLENLVTLFMRGAVSPSSDIPAPLALVPTVIEAESLVIDLPANLVHTILQRARKSGLQDYALVYLLFGAGLSAVELRGLTRSQHISDEHQQFLQIMQGTARQIPINQWIMGKRYGSYTKNPLTQWLKSRKDNQPEVFLNDDGAPLSETQLQQRWQELTQDLNTPEGRSPTIVQAQQTWCVEMLVRGMQLEDLQILTGWEIQKLQRYVQRAKERAALEQAIRLDQKT